MDYSSLFASGFRAISSSRHRRGSSAMESASPTSPNFPSVPWPQRRERTLSLVISPQKQRPSIQPRSAVIGGDGGSSSIAELAMSAWDSPTLPNPASCLYPHGDAESDKLTPPGNMTCGTPVAFSPINGTAHQRARKSSITGSFLSFSPSPAEDMTYTYPKVQLAVSPTSTDAPRRPRSRRHTLAPSLQIDRKGWINSPLPPIPSSPSQARNRKPSELHSGGSDEGKEDWRSVIDDLLKTDTPLAL